MTSDPVTSVSARVARYYDRHTAVFLWKWRAGILDLGCGVGASLEYLVSGTGVAAKGVTNSGVQARLATSRLAGRAAIWELDFYTAPLGGQVDLAYATSRSYTHRMPVRSSGMWRAHWPRVSCS